MQIYYQKHTHLIARRNVPRSTKPEFRHVRPDKFRAKKRNRSSRFPASRAAFTAGDGQLAQNAPSGLLENGQNWMKTPDLCAWPGASRSDCRRCREDEQ